MMGDQIVSSTSLSNDVSSWSPVLSKLTGQKNALVAEDPSEAEVFCYGVIECGGNCFSLTGLATLNQTTVVTQFIGMGRVDRSSFRQFIEVLAHELAHNHRRKHTSSEDVGWSCGFPEGVDRNYPYNTLGASCGRIGKTGYDHSVHRLIDQERYRDLMTYCRDRWISDDRYKKIYECQARLTQRSSKSEDGRSEQGQREGVMVYGELLCKENGS